MFVIYFVFYVVVHKNYYTKPFLLTHIYKLSKLKLVLVFSYFM